MKHVLTALAFSLLLVGWSPPAGATVGWFIVEVIRAGVTNDGRVFFRLKDLADVPAFNSKNFSIPDLVSKEMLAIGLSALAGNLSIRVRVDPEESGPRARCVQDQALALAGLTAYQRLPHRLGASQLDMTS